jgi:hypothetical protein
MFYEGVCFVEEACSKMTKEEFIEHHKGTFWQDRDEKTREKMLADVYERMFGKTESKPAKKSKK